jgi:hypothetical protein
MYKNETVTDTGHCRKSEGIFVHSNCGKTARRVWRKLVRAAPGLRKPPTCTELIQFAQAMLHIYVFDTGLPNARPRHGLRSHRVFCHHLLGKNSGRLTYVEWVALDAPIVLVGPRSRECSYIALSFLSSIPHILSNAEW